MDCPIVQTQYGKVQGRLCSKLNEKQVYSYSKIPFAKPPVKDLRFQPPQDPEPWEGVLKVGVNNVAPPQDQDIINQLKDFFLINNEFDIDYMNSGTEDCLYLEVYTNCPNSDKKLPVLFWIYGGGFQMGSSNWYNGKVLASLHDVVVVVPNYRLNAFGFFTTGKDSEYPGNMGMYDQLKALQWVKNNIAAFGGNPDNVTIHGESAGSMSVGLHCISPLSKGLFHKAISHSGVGDFPMLVKEDYGAALKQFLEEMGITSQDPKVYMKELKESDQNKIIKALVKQNKQLMNCFGPYVDGKFFPKSPGVMIKENGFHKIPHIIGFNSDEGSGLMQAENPGFKEGLTEKQFDEQLAMMMRMICFAKPDKADDVAKLVKSNYSKLFNDDDKLKWSRIMGKIGGDLNFATPSSKTLDSLAGDGYDVYMYHMSQKTSWFQNKDLFEEDKMRPEICGTDHGDDIAYTFGIPLYDGPYSRSGVTFTDQEKEFSKQWMNYVVNFATTGNPNTGEKVPVEWPRYDVKNKAYIDLNHNSQIKENYNGDIYKMWTEEVPALMS